MSFFDEKWLEKLMDIAYSTLLAWCEYAISLVCTFAAAALLHAGKLLKILKDA
jgi:hypothetical protein